MQDQFERRINYMRISITDRCNLRCRYCMPEDLKLVPMDSILSFEEIERVVRAAVGLGIVHFRITGGEPLVRKGCLDLVRMIKKIPQVETVSLTTNGILLADNSKALYEAGVRKINVSLDTADADEFAAITGRDYFGRVVEGIESALAAGIKVKLNAVSGAAGDLKALVDFAQSRGLILRFIELMPIGFGSAGKYVSNETILEELMQYFGPAAIDEEKQGNGPAVYRRFLKLQYPIGFISAVHDKFCSSCNRVRLTSTGFLKGCLCYDVGTDIREILRGGCSDSELTGRLRDAIYSKPRAHCFEDRELITETREMSRIGG